MKKISTLIIEDMQDERERLVDILHKIFPYYTVSVSTAEVLSEARSKLESGRYDLAMVDCELEEGKLVIDAMYIAKMINDLQPNCTRMAISIADLSRDPLLSRPGVYSLIVRKQDLYGNPQSVRERLKEFGF